MKDMLTVSTEEAIRMCSEVLQIVEPHISTEVEIEKRYYDTLSEGIELEWDAYEKLKPLTEWYERHAPSPMLWPLYTFFQPAKDEITKTIKNCQIAKEGKYTFSADTLTILRQCKDEGFVDEMLVALAKAEPIISTYNRDLLAKKLKGKQEGAKPEGPTTVIVSTPPPSPWWIIVGVVVFVAALVAGSMS